MKKSYHDSKLRPPRDLAHDCIGERMRSMRLERGLSLRDVQNLGGPSVATLQLAESGLVSMNVATLKTLADVLKVAPAVFLVDEPHEFIEHEHDDINAIALLVYQMPAKDVLELKRRLKKKVVN